MTEPSYVKCMQCGKQKGLAKLRREIAVLQGFYQQQPAYRLVSDLGLDAKTITRVYQRLRLVLFHTVELEGAKLSGEIEMDESYFGGTHKGQRCGGARGKRIVFGLLEQDGRVYTRWWSWSWRRPPHDPYREPYPQGLGLLYGCLSRLSVFAVLW